MQLVDYCDVFISCLDFHSDGTHSLQRINWWERDVMIKFTKSVLMKTISSTLWLAWGWVNVHQKCMFSWTIPSKLFEPSWFFFALKNLAELINMNLWRAQVLSTERRVKGVCVFVCECASCCASIFCLQGVFMNTSPLWNVIYIFPLERMLMRAWAVKTFCQRLHLFQHWMDVCPNIVLLFLVHETCTYTSSVWHIYFECIISVSFLWGHQYCNTK